MIHQGKIVSENYYNSEQEDIINIFSVTKSFTSTLIGQAIDMGMLANTDSSVSYFFPDVDVEYLDQIKLHNLLSMTTGYFDGFGYPWWMWSTTEELLNMSHTSPGTFFYNNSACHINSHILFHGTGMTPSEFGANYLFPYLGIDNPYWLNGYLQINDGSASLHLNLRDMVKLGQLYLQGGSSGSEQVISSNWIDRATSAQTSTGWGYYGYLWWLNDDFGTSYSAQGLGGQIIAVFPEYDLVIGAQSDIFGPSDINTHSNLLNNRIINVAEIFEGYVNEESLPTISSFSLIAQDTLVLLNWDPMNIEGFSYYLLERSLSEEFDAEIVSNYLSNNYFQDDDLEYDTEYFYRVAYVTDEISPYSDTLSVTLEFLNDNNGPKIPEHYVLYDNFPNPFNPVTTIKYNIPKKSHVKITIHDMMGNLVNVLVDEYQNKGSKSVQWDGRNTTGNTLSTGLYVYTIQSGDFRNTKKMLLIK